MLIILQNMVTIWYLRQLFEIGIFIHSAWRFVKPSLPLTLKDQRVPNRDDFQSLCFSPTSKAEFKK